MIINQMFKPTMLTSGYLLLSLCVLCIGLESYYVLESSNINLSNHRSATMENLNAGYVSCNIACSQSQTCVVFFLKTDDQQCHLQYAHVIKEDIIDEPSSSLQYWRPENVRCPRLFYFVPRFSGCYWFSPRTERPEIAESICEADNAHLLYLETPEELSYIQRQISSSPMLLKKNNYRTGGIKNGETWRWGIGGTPVNTSLITRLDQTMDSLKLMSDTDGYRLFTSRSGDIAFICEADIM